MHLIRDSFSDFGCQEIIQLYIFPASSQPNNLVMRNNHAEGYALLCFYSPSTLVGVAWA